MLTARQSRAQETSPARQIKQRGSADTLVSGLGACKVPESNSVSERWQSKRGIVELYRTQPQRRLVSQPVLKDPRSPSALRHWIANCPRTLLELSAAAEESSCASSTSGCSSSRKAT
jgi:hypothetical protein